MAVDGNTTTSWQEGVNGNGEGEYLEFRLSGESKIRAITVNMGNWRDQSNYNQNGRPRDITVWLDSTSFSVTIPDGMTQYCIEFTSAVTASKVKIRIDSVYKGTNWEDTCISEITFYAE